MLRILAVGLLVLPLSACPWDEQKSDAAAATPPPPVNQAPTISTVATESSIMAGNPFQVTPTASDPENDPLTFEIANQPAWASFDSATGRLSGTPADANVGTYDAVQISVRDSVNVTQGNAFRIVVECGARDAAGQPPARDLWQRSDIGRRRAGVRVHTGGLRS